MSRVENREMLRRQNRSLSLIQNEEQIEHNEQMSESKEESPRLAQVPVAVQLQIHRYPTQSACTEMSCVRSESSDVRKFSDDKDDVFM